MLLTSVVILGYQIKLELAISDLLNHFLSHNTSFDQGFLNPKNDMWIIGKFLSQGGGGTLKFSVYIGEADFLGVKILNFRILGGFQKNYFFFRVVSFLWIFFLGSSIILSNFLGFAHFLGNLFISLNIRVAYTYINVLQGLKIQFCLRPCLITGLGEILEA